MMQIDVTWYDHMGEVDPYQLQPLEGLRRSRLRPYAARAVLWSAGGRILGDPYLSQVQRNQADIYLKTMLDAVSAIEQQDMAFVGQARNDVTTRMDMGHMMGWAFLEIHRAMFPYEFDPLNRSHQEIAIRMQLTIGVIEDYLGESYRRFMVYEAAQAQDRRQTVVKWY